MKNFKKMFLLLSLLCLPSCSDSLVKPNDTDLEFWISDRPSKELLLEEGYKVIPGWMGATEYLSPNYEAISEEVFDDYFQYRKPEVYVSYVIGGYPDCSDKDGVIHIDITDPKVRVFGLTMESEQSTIEEKMKSLNFKQDKDYPVNYSKGRLNVHIHSSGIYISYRTTNRKGIDY